VRGRVPLIAVAVLAFAAVAFVVARFLSVEGAERQAIVELLRKRTEGPVTVIRLDSDTAYSLGDSEGWTRVVWARDEHSVPVVQCVRVRRQGDPVTGRTVTLLRLQAPLRDSEGSCR
jgi:hypothetical protein